LHKLQTTSKAFVVFNTEGSRDAALAAMRDGVAFRGVTLKVEETLHEPDSIMWGNMHNDSMKDKAKHFAWGISMILLALLVWTLVFYLPYVWISLSATFAHGHRPDALASFTFGMVVVAGNALMYVVCGEVADRMHFQYVDSRELCYMGLYLFACIVNVMLDMLCAYHVAYYAMVGVGMRTYDGTKLADVSTFPERFETYAMQRELGRTILIYTFPFTTLVPFLCEPVITIYLPWKIMVALVRSKPEIQGITAEAYLKPLVMDMSRYADVLLNVMLATCILFFPGGFNLTMFIGLAISHIYIYVFDHYRVLRAITSCDFASMTIDWWAQWVMCLPCAIILMCYIYKSNCEGYVKLDNVEHMPHFDESIRKLSEHFHGCEDGYGIIFKCATAFVGHVIMHTAILMWVVPCFGRKNKEPFEESYEHCARRIPISWFSGNPVHCLRSQFIYDHFPPCDYSLLGKQHLVRVNPRIGCHFTEKEAEAEDFTEPSVHDLTPMAQMANRKAMDTVTSLTSRLSRNLSTSSTREMGASTTSNELNK